MKTYITLFFLILIILITIKPKTELVSLEIEDGKYTKVITCTSLTTKNIGNLENKIIGIYPYINPIYKDKLKKLEYYKLDSIDNFTNLYLKTLEKNGYLEDLYKYKLNGIKIEKIEIYISDIETNLINNMCN